MFLALLLASASSIDESGLANQVRQRAAALLSCCHLCCNTTSLVAGVTAPKAWPKRGGGNWRDLLLPISRTLDDASLLVDGDVYIFGVAAGRSLLSWRDILLRNEVRTWGARKGTSVAPPLRSPPKKWYGFDSFAGLPETNRDEKLAGWRKGSYRNTQQGPREIARRYFNEDDRRSSGIPFKVSLELIPGFYNDSLTTGIIAQFDMRRATFVEIDCDLYVSSVQALDFMFRNRLIVSGTLIGYDDWWVVPCVAKSRWISALEVGEGLAHAEMAKRYDVEFICLAGPCKFPSGSSWPNMHAHRGAWGAIFLVASIGAGKGSPGFMSPREELAFRSSQYSCGY